MRRRYGVSLKRMANLVSVSELGLIASGFLHETGSAVRRSKDPLAADWGQGEELLATVADRLAHLSWQWGGDHNADPPQPYPRPFPLPSLDDDDELTPDQVFDTPDDWEAWRAAQYEQQIGDESVN